MLVDLAGSLFILLLLLLAIHREYYQQEYKYSQYILELKVHLKYEKMHSELAERVLDENFESLAKILEILKENDKRIM